MTVPGIDVEIVIRDNTTGQYLKIPVIPEEIPYSDGEAMKATVKIVNLGNVDFPDGVNLDSLSLASFFPANYDPYLCVCKPLAPLEYRNKFSYWKDHSTPLQVIIPAIGVNKTMVVKTFEWVLKGAEGDIYYTLGFGEEKTIRPKKVTPGGTVPIAGAKTPVDRAAAPAPAKAKTYTIQAGDTLTLIAKKLGIADWHTIYDKNKAVIGANPNKIVVGKVLTL